MEGCDTVIFWAFVTVLWSVRRNYVSTELPFFVDPLQISQIVNKWTNRITVMTADGEKLQYKEKIYFTIRLC